MKPCNLKQLLDDDASTDQIWVGLYRWGSFLIATRVTVLSMLHTVVHIDQWGLPEITGRREESIHQNSWEQPIYTPIHKVKIWLGWFWSYYFDGGWVASVCQHFICKRTQNAKEPKGPLEMKWCCSWLLQGQDVKQRVNNYVSLFNFLLHFSDPLLYYSKFDVNVPVVTLINLMLSAKSLPGSIVHFQGGVLLLLFHRNCWFHHKGCLIFYYFFTIWYCGCLAPGPIVL